MALKQSNMAEELIFSGEGCPARTQPLIPSAMLLVRLQIGDDGELLRVASAADESLLAMGPLVMILHA